MSRFAWFACCCFALCMTTADVRWASGQDKSSAVAEPRQKRTFEGLREFHPPAPAPEDSVVAIVGAALIDGRGGPPVKDSLVIVRGNRIAAVGSGDSLEIPPDATRVDARDLTLLPGLVDSHLHVGGSERQILRTLPLFLSHGVTSARDPGHATNVFEVVRRSNPQSPRLFLTGPHYDREPPAYPQNCVIIQNAEHARQTTKEYVQQGATAVKVYFRLPEELIQATCHAAHELGIPVTAHLELIDADRAIRAGLDGVEHITSFGTVLAESAVAEKFRSAVDAENEARREGRYRLWATLNLEDSPRTQPLLDLITQRGVFISPTLAVFERRAGDKGAQDYHARGFENMMKFVGLCHRAGATVVTGSHTSSPKVEFGWAFQREMELLLESGLPPMAVIQASTLNNAKFLGCADRVGSVEPGKLADLLLIAGNPLADIRAMYNVRRVMLNGKWIEN